MKKSEYSLFKVAAKLVLKYAQGQSLQDIIQNAASYGETSQNGIMDFPTQLKRDRADMNISISISSGNGIAVSEPALDPQQVAGNYAKLPGQIKKYLDTYIKDFPQITAGNYNLSYSGKSPNSGIGS